MNVYVRRKLVYQNEAFICSWALASNCRTAFFQGCAFTSGVSISLRSTVQLFTPLNLYTVHGSQCACIFVEAIAIDDEEPSKHRKYSRKHHRMSTKREKLIVYEAITPTVLNRNFVLLIISFLNIDSESVCCILGHYTNFVHNFYV